MKYFTMKIYFIIFLCYLFVSCKATEINNGINESPGVIVNDEISLSNSFITYLKYKEIIDEAQYDILLNGKKIKESDLNYDKIKQYFNKNFFHDKESNKKYSNQKLLDMKINWDGTLATGDYKLGAIFHPLSIKKQKRKNYVSITIIPYIKLNETEKIFITQKTYSENKNDYELIEYELCKDSSPKNQFINWFPELRIYPYNCNGKQRIDDIFNHIYSLDENENEFLNNRFSIHYNQEDKTLKLNNKTINKMKDIINNSEGDILHECIHFLNNINNKIKICLFVNENCEKECSKNVENGNFGKWVDEKYIILQNDEILLKKDYYITLKNKVPLGIYSNPKESTTLYGTLLNDRSVKITQIQDNKENDEFFIEIDDITKDDIQLDESKQELDKGIKFLLFRKSVFTEKNSIRISKIKPNLKKDKTYRSSAPKKTITNHKLKKEFSPNINPRPIAMDINPVMDNIDIQKNELRSYIKDILEGNNYFSLKNLKMTKENSYYILDINIKSTLSKLENETSIRTLLFPIWQKAIEIKEINKIYFYIRYNDIPIIDIEGWNRRTPKAFQKLEFIMEEKI